MGLYKEADYAFEELRKRQVRIYPDACDEGIFVNGPRDPLCAKVKEMLDSKELLGGIKRHRELFNYGASYGVYVKFLLPWEHVEGCPGKSSGTEWLVSYVHDRLVKKCFIQLDARRTVWDDENIWERG